MRLICFWCALVAAVRAQDYYAPQTFRQPAVGLGGLFRPVHRPWNTMMRLPNRIDDGYHRSLFTPAGNDVTPQGTIVESWRPNAGPAPVREQYREPASFRPGPILPQAEPWRAPYPPSKEQQAAILHHKQSLSSEGNFRFEYASDNGLAAGEVIEPDGSRVGAYQYKDPTGQIIKLKYKAGKDGFQILEGSHVPKSPEPVPPPTTDQHHKHAYEQQRQQYELQQQYNQQRPETNSWKQNQGYDGGRDRDARPAGQYFVQNWKLNGQDDGQYHENEVEEQQNRGPHTFGEGFEFAFQG